VARRDRSGEELKMDMDLLNLLFIPFILIVVGASFSGQSCPDGYIMNESNSKCYRVTGGETVFEEPRNDYPLFVTYGILGVAFLYPFAYFYFSEVRR